MTDTKKTEDKTKDIVKRRLLVLLRLLYEETDEDHPLDTFQILSYLEEQGVPANRKTLKSDIDAFVDAGLDIVTVFSKPNRYFWGERSFELPELKLLIDAVSSSRFITQKKSNQLAAKLAGFASTGQRQELDRHIYATHRVKSSNEQIYYTVDTLSDAISDGRKIAFQYTEYDANKKKILRNDGEVYELSPYALFWNEDFYYVVGYSEKHGNVSAFRVDRLHRPRVLEEAAVPQPADFDLDDYSRRVFEMYEGEEVEVTLSCRNDLMKYLIDRFGEDIETRVIDKDHFVATVSVKLSPTFYGWVFQFGGAIRIVSPGRAVSEISHMARKLMEAEKES